MIAFLAHIFVFTSLALLGGVILALIYNRIIKPIRAKLCPVKAKAKRPVRRKASR